MEVAATISSELGYRASPERVDARRALAVADSRSRKELERMCDLAWEGRSG